jgi:hypothetical protein
MSCVPKSRCPGVSYPSRTTGTFIWETHVMTTLYCPKCGYNLTGLTDEHCPECGEGFDRYALAATQARALRRARGISYQVLFTPIAFAFIAPFISAPIASLFDDLSERVRIVLSVLALAPPFVVPIIHGIILGKTYARARICSPCKPDRRLPKPFWFYPVLFAMIESLLMVFYIGVGIALIFLAVLVSR